ncbi:MAG: LytTR family transcriptional regulator [Gemmatimonadetes bacterium]|nr:LytTR family transcriptional regulator [Gemmatimonadota bacterium]
MPRGGIFSRGRSRPSRPDSTRFARIHRAYLVNLAAVREFRRAGKDRFVAVLSSGQELPVSRQRAQHLRGWTR